MVNERESVTAKLCAFARAWHSNKSHHKIYDDYLAYDMMGKEEYDEIYEMVQNNLFEGAEGIETKSVDERVEEYIAPIPLARISFSESRLRKFAEENEKVQYVICGAGADTFSFRNTNPKIQIFEVDHPDTQLYKLAKIKSLEWIIPEQVHFVSVDFEKEKMIEKLLKAGFDPEVKTFFSILGVSYYLTLPVFTETLLQIAKLSAVGSVVAFDYPQKGNNYPKRVQQLEEMTYSLGEVMQEGYTYNELSRALYTLGFQMDTYLSPQKIQAYYFNNRQDGLRAFENVYLVAATYTSGFDYE